jgi:carboxypeptidase Taq
MAAFCKATVRIPLWGDNSFTMRDRLRVEQAIINGTALGVAGTVGRVRALEKSLRAWEAARAANDFSLAAPALQKVIDSMRKEARAKSKAMGYAPYEALLRSRTPGFRTGDFERFAARAEIFSRNALKNRALMPPAPPAIGLERAAQKELQDKILANLGYRGKVAETDHPICLGTHGDVRIGTGYDEGDVLYGLWNAMHEGGHGIFREGLPAEYKKRLVGQVAGVALDEAMALLMENHIGRTREFTANVARQLPEGRISAKDIFNRATALSNAPVRLQADEVRYPLDVIIRYRLEKDMIEGVIDAKDLPEAWADEYQKLTGMRPKDDNEGVLQDVHWFAGEFAWFPNYMIGQLAAAQIFEKAEQDVPNLRIDLVYGDTSRLRQWLQEKIYNEGARLDTFELVERVTGRKLDTLAWERHIQAKYAPLFPPQPGP